MNSHNNLVTEAGKSFINRVINNFKDKVVQTPFARIPDIHRWSFSDRF
jgi:hypothetical protein